MFTNFNSLVEKRWTREGDIFMWTKRDEGAWSGPYKDWIKSHNEIYFKYIKKYDVCVQAGGNHGMYPAFLSQKFETVYTFEPDALNFHCLVNNCQTPRIIKINAALGDTHKMIDITNTETNRCNTGMFKVIPEQTGIIPQLKLDDFDLPACDFICLDVEDYELNVLKGSINIIKKFSPVISAENGQMVRDFLDGLGYKEVDRSVADHIFVRD